jgi:hypothetical protein
MSRYINDIPTSRSAEEVERTVSDFLTGEGFHRQQRGYEEVWAKGSGLLVGQQFVKATPVNGHVHIEAWIKALYAAEMGTEGVFGAVPKRMLKQRVVELEQLLS